MNRIEAIVRDKTPEAYLHDILAQTKAQNLWDQESLVVLQGRRYRGVFKEYKAVYPDNVPNLVPITREVAFNTQDESVHNLVTRKVVHAGDLFWSRHGFELLLRISLGEDSSVNEGARI